ncbi:hypothetical protein FRACYDRAFT_245689 [Fragilariopsis cylindrus CCMP1102]|uniref:Purinergic receptor n=1 Tax=Fragilariopsis cylindrus CCMP1102 TaxID=635003 RepID=A0A1E7EZU9_9STRA|nr:hypothetical protein FRACYDRAFT_245689 [Fragilariopsis cylindrus CCMP1102]|eukprot:OEU11349.1 hypothetical protein FRACYDRAFT_245689 [Fragilariopsis cylindrus CCMP1102]
MICAYDTVKYVHIKDARLGALRYCLLIIIFIYVIVFEMWALGGYLESSPVVGVVRFSLQQPTAKNCDPSQPGCFNAFSSLNTIEYCEQYDANKVAANNNKSIQYKGNIYPCEIYEAINAQILSEKSITVITRATLTNQTLACHEHDLTCSRTYNDALSLSSSFLERKYYIAQSEAFTLLFDHAVTASKICTNHGNSHPSSTSYTCSAQASDYEGRLFSISDRLCVQEHTGVNLDDCSTSSSSGKPCQTYRDSGATMLLNIYWADFNLYQGRVEPYYYYKTQFIAGSTFKQYIPFYDNNYRQSRTLLNAHGIKIAVLLGGEFNQFNAVTFLVTLTTALGLLAVATTIVDNLMLYILPERERYQEVKYENTEEFEQNGGVLSATLMAGLNQLVSSRQDDGVLIDHPDENIAVPVVADNANEHDALNEPLL